jgi:hypothetical protein
MHDVHPAGTSQLDRPDSHVYNNYRVSHGKILRQLDGPDSLSRLFSGAFLAM